MKALDYQILNAFIDAEVDAFYQSRLKALNNLTLKEILKKNPFLFRAKNLLDPTVLISSMLDARLSASEEKQFGDLLENVAVFVAEQTCDGRKSSAKGIDLEFDDEGTRYLVAIKSGPNWGNSSQYQSLELNFRKAIQVQEQTRHHLPIQAVLGMCYGNSRDVNTGHYVKKMGQSFWYFLSDDLDLYEKILEQIGLRAGYHNRNFLEERMALESRLTEELLENYCSLNRQIDWSKILRFNSGNVN